MQLSVCKNWAFKDYNEDDDERKLHSNKKHL
jgi:hypothetical protein